MCLHSLCEWDVALPFQTRGPAARGRTPGPACWRPGWRSAGVQQTGLHSCRVCLWSSLIKALYRWEGMWVKHCTGLWLPGSLAPCLAVSKQLLLSKHAVPPARTELGTKPALCPVWRVGGWASGRGASSRFGRASWVSRSFPLHFKVNFKSRPAAGTLAERARGRGPADACAACGSAFSATFPAPSPAAFIHSSSSCAHLGRLERQCAT